MSKDSNTLFRIANALDKIVAMLEKRDSEIITSVSISTDDLGTTTFADAPSTPTGE